GKRRLEKSATRSATLNRRRGESAALASTRLRSRATLNDFRHRLIYPDTPPSRSTKCNQSPAALPLNTSGQRRFLPGLLHRGTSYLAARLIRFSERQFGVCP